MSGPSLARGIAVVLTRGLAETAPAPGDREATVQAMRAALRRRRARRVWFRSLAGIAAAAALVLAVLGAARKHAATPAIAAVPAMPSPPATAEHLSGGVLVLSGGHTSPLVDARAIVTGDHVLALLDGQAEIALPSGTRLSVAGGGDVALLADGPTQLFALGAGSVQADVAKLRPGERFVIRTADAEVEVRGTSFRVAVAAADPACGGGTTTRVNVFQGTVMVRAQGKESAVRAGQSWPAECGEGAVRGQTASSAAPLEPPSPRAPATGVSGAASPAARPEASPKSELAAENDLFDLAMQGKRRGDVRGAIASFDRLLARYPGCPLAESAEAERMKLVAEADRDRGAEAAREYLRRYPSGFARGDAEALLHGARQNTE